MEEGRGNMPEKSTHLNKRVAVLLAEEFIKLNGYTGKKIAPNTELTNESFEFYADDNEKLKNRYNTLKPKAVGAKFDDKKWTWTVGFEYNEERNPQGDEKTGRVVVMDGNGDNIQVQHKDFFLENLE